MPRRWLVNTSNNRLVGVIDDDDAAVPAGREGVAQNVITATGVARADIKTNGLWVVTNGVGNYTAPAACNDGADTRPAANYLGAEHHQELVARRQRNAGHYRRCCERADGSPVLDALVRCITANASVDDHYDVRCWPKALVNGFDFVLYAGPQWDNTTNGYYRGGVPPLFFPNGNWSFRTINQNLAASPSEGNTGGTTIPTSPPTQWG